MRLVCFLVVLWCSSVVDVRGAGWQLRVYNHSTNAIVFKVSYMMNGSMNWPVSRSAPVGGYWTEVSADCPSGPYATNCYWRVTVDATVCCPQASDTGYHYIKAGNCEFGIPDVTAVGQTCCGGTPCVTNYTSIVGGVFNNTATGLEYALNNGAGYVRAGGTIGYVTNMSSSFVPAQLWVTSADGNTFTDPSWTSYSTNSDCETPTENSPPLNHNLTNAMGGQYQGGTSNILWGTNVTMSGFSALVDALKETAAQAHEDAKRALTNCPCGAGARDGGTNDYPEDWTNGITIKQLTNWFDEHKQASMSVSGSMTNGASALVAGRSALGSVVGDYDSLVDSLQGVGSGGGLTGAGSSSIFSFNFAGHTLDFGPESVIPGIMSAVKAAWTFLVLYAFAVWAGPWVYRVVETFSSVQTGGVPNLEATIGGCGGNIAGFVAAIAVPFAIIAVWVGVLTVFSSGVLSYVGMLPDASSGLGLNGNQGALYLLNASFPVSLALGCASARVTLPLAGAKMALIASASSRFLVGK